MMSISFLYLLIACGEKQSDNATLPPQDTAEETASYEPSFELEPSSEGNEAFDESPQQMLNIQHAGIWNLSPAAGPYNSMYGELNIQELINGYTVVPYCDFTFGVTGYVTENICDTCDFGFDIDFFVLEPDAPSEEDEEIIVPDDFPQAEEISDCFSPELPAHQETRTLAYSFADEMLYFNYHNTDIWVPWYPAVFLSDTLEVFFQEDVGFFGAGDD